MYVFLPILLLFGCNKFCKSVFLYCLLSEQEGEILFLSAVDKKNYFCFVPLTDSLCGDRKTGIRVREREKSKYNRKDIRAHSLSTTVLIFWKIIFGLFCFGKKQSFLRFNFLNVFFFSSKTFIPVSNFIVNL